MSKNRKYNCKDVEMLMAAKTIAESFRANISELATARTDWTEQFATNLIARIDQAIESHLGVDAKKDLRQATATLATIQLPARRDVSFLKTQDRKSTRLNSSHARKLQTSRIPSSA